MLFSTRGAPLHHRHITFFILTRQNKPDSLPPEHAVLVFQEIKGTKQQDEFFIDMKDNAPSNCTAWEKAWGEIGTLHFMKLTSNKKIEEIWD